MRDRNRTTINTCRNHELSRFFASHHLSSRAPPYCDRDCRQQRSSAAGHPAVVPKCIIYLNSYNQTSQTCNSSLELDVDWESLELARCFCRGTFAAAVDASLQASDAIGRPTPPHTGPHNNADIDRPTTRATATLTPPPPVDLHHTPRDGTTPSS
jgi:hypothetical protein